MIDAEEVVRDQEAEPFSQLVKLGRGWSQTAAAFSLKAKTPDPLSRVGSLNIEALVPLLRPGANGGIVFPVEAALNFAPQARKRRAA
jgi:hypothetical protein